MKLYEIVPPKKIEPLFCTILVGFYQLLSSFWGVVDEFTVILPRKALQSLVPKSSPSDGSDGSEVAADPSVATMDLCRLPTTKAEPEKLSKTATWQKTSPFAMWKINSDLMMMVI